MLNDNTLNYPRNVVLDRLKTNRAKHEAEYEAALEGYHAAYRAKLEAFLEVTEETPMGFAGSAADHHKHLTRHTTKLAGALAALQSLPVPKEFLEEYDRAIDMLEHCVENKIEMASADYDQYMRDKWSWKGQFAATSGTYTGKH